MSQPNQRGCLRTFSQNNVVAPVIFDVQHQTGRLFLASVGLGQIAGPAGKVRPGRKRQIRCRERTALGGKQTERQSDVFLCAHRCDTSALAGGTMSRCRPQQIEVNFAKKTNHNACRIGMKTLLTIGAAVDVRSIALSAQVYSDCHRWYNIRLYSSPGSRPPVGRPRFTSNAGLKVPWQQVGDAGWKTDHDRPGPGRNAPPRSNGAKRVNVRKYRSRHEDSSVCRHPGRPTPARNYS